MFFNDDFKELRNNILFSFNFWEEPGRNWDAFFPGSHDAFSKPFKCLSGKSLILSKATSYMLSKVFVT